MTMRSGPAGSSLFFSMTCSIHLSWLVMASAMSSFERFAVAVADSTLAAGTSTKANSAGCWL
ncbi:MAG: hypothetical protein A2X76_09810 [Lysobacterales bacterium GWF1_69_6]|nr:MAG: hypothetical protein A2X76_09810 [Xanthomonadales bacterium GWF1_69_6]